MIDPRLDPTLTPERLGAIKAGNDPRGLALVTTRNERDRLANATPYRPRSLHSEGVHRRTFWLHGDAAVARIYRILQGAAKSSSFEQAIAGAEYPRLAREYAETWLYYQTRSQPAPLGRVDHNPYRNLSDFDADRKFRRAVEDICDRSTGVLGAWATK